MPEKDSAYYNQAFFGYITLAADRLGYTEEQESKLKAALLRVMDDNSFEQARNVYLNH
ncbi:hypothetical protein [Sporolactobacillus terrae]|uniref:hypothetical protein n=1 Tax=Sporolactobacillus terrae TaxID=269673 RepID=UPI001CC18362|nr:hypothetical protein [Sporolactobacillus terrae]UAK17590.1 hypothetical protein K7399_06600 [Sporolactobacillus terrae]